MKLRQKLKTIALKNSLANTILIITRRFWGMIFFPGSKEYWEQRYSGGGTSGNGSYGKYAEFKAEIINSFVKDNEISSVIEYGCGDGNQLSLFDFPNYFGLDVSESAIRSCMDRFKTDKTKSFFLYDSRFYKDNHSIFKADLALSLDVIYHLVEDDIYSIYMRHLFSSADKFVIIYSSNMENNPKKMLPHCKSRIFTKWIDDNINGWRLIEKINNKYPTDSQSDFYIYKKIK